MPTTRRLVLAALGAVAAPASGWAQGKMIRPAALQAAVDYAQSQHTTGFLVIQDRKTLAEKNWPMTPGPGAAAFRGMAYETTADGALLEDVASQQKSFVSVLLAIAVDKGLLDLERPVGAYIGPGWSKAARAQEDKIRVLDLMTMSSGLKEDFTYAAPANTVFLYNTPVYAVLKRVLAAAKAPLEQVTADWLTTPLGMKDTAWRKRPAAMADVGNPTGLVTSPRDTARFGQLILNRGKTDAGVRVVSEGQIKAMMTPTLGNLGYGRLWWLNGSVSHVKPLDRFVEGPLIPSAPSDLLAALGALDRKLYIVPSRQLIVVRMGMAAPDKDFDEQLWKRLAPALA